MKLLAWLIVPPAAVAGIILAVANRTPVFVSVDPVTSGAPPLGMEMPLYALIFVSIFVGIILGSTATWLKQGKWRKAARGGKKQAKALSGELASV